MDDQRDNDNDNGGDHDGDSNGLYPSPPLVPEEPLPGSDSPSSPTDPTPLNLRISLRRETLNLSHRDLARRARVPLDRVKKVELGMKPWISDHDLIGKIAEVLGLAITPTEINSFVPLHPEVPNPERIYAYLETLDRRLTRACEEMERYVGTRESKLEAYKDLIDGAVAEIDTQLREWRRSLTGSILRILKRLDRIDGRGSGLDGGDGKGGKSSRPDSAVQLTEDMIGLLIPVTSTVIGLLRSDGDPDAEESAAELEQTLERLFADRI